MNELKRPYFSRGELALWLGSLGLILFSFLVFDRSSYLSLAASLIGATSLIFCAKGNPFGQMLMIIFSLLYAIISFSFRYYGEVITYLGMTTPMAVFSLVSWLRHPYGKDKTQVKVGRVSAKETVFMLILTAVVTVAFYFILYAFGTSNLVPRVISVTTSFMAAYLTFRRSPYFALAYAANDVILIVLWVLASMSNISYISVVICFATFLVNDLYGFINWKRIQRLQACNI